MGWVCRLVLLAMTWTALSAQAGFSAKETEPSEDELGLCGVAANSMQQAVEKARKELTNGLPAGALTNNCAQQLTRYFDSCSNEQNLQSIGCKKQEPQAGVQSPGGGGIPQGADRMAAGLVEDANCKRRVGQCISRGGGLREQQEYHKVLESCKNGDKLSFSPVENPQTPRDRDRSARNELLRRIYYAQERYKTCLNQKGKTAEDLARQTLEDSRAARADGSRTALTCIDTAYGHRECEVSKNGERLTPADGQREDGHVRDPEADRDNPVRLDTANGGHCSGTLLGDGQTVVTAGHCVGAKVSNDSGAVSSERDITVRDSSGQEHTVRATCNGQWDGVGYSDVARCTLSRPIQANPVYVATHDPTIQGSGCVTEGYIKRCGSGFFENLTNKPLTVWGQPGDSGLSRSVGNFTGTGTNGWLWKNGVLYHDLVCTGGCSGSGYIVDVDGQRVVVGAHSYGNVYGIGRGGGTYPTYRQWQGLRVQSVSTEKLENASLFFQELQ